MNKHTTALSLATLLVALVLVGCEGTTSRNPPIEVWPDMDRQGKGKPQGESEIFSDKRVSRPPVPGTVARGFLKDDDVYYTGLVNNMYVGKNPEKIDADLMKLGQARFNTYCSPCHDRTGSGNKSPRGSSSRDERRGNLQHHHQWPAFDADLQESGHREGPLGNCGVRSCASARVCLNHGGRSG